MPEEIKEEHLPVFDVPSYSKIEKTTDYPTYNNKEESLNNNLYNNTSSQNITNKEKANNEVYDLRFAINNFRQAVQNTEKFGFKVETEEFDFDNVYQIIIRIDKNK